LNTRNAEFRIDGAGRWYYRDSPVERPGLLRMLAAMLHRDGPGYVLETPEQRLRVEVEDAPFLIVDCEWQHGRSPPRLVLVDNFGRRNALDAEHPLAMRAVAPGGELRAYQEWPDGLGALLHRNVFYRLADSAVQEPGGARLGILSDGLFFALE